MISSSWKFSFVICFVISSFTKFLSTSALEVEQAVSKTSEEARMIFLDKFIFSFYPYSFSIFIAYKKPVPKRTSLAVIPPKFISINKLNKYRNLICDITLALSWSKNSATRLKDALPYKNYKPSQLTVFSVKNLFIRTFLIKVIYTTILVYIVFL